MCVLRDLAGVKRAWTAEDGRYGLRMVMTGPWTKQSQAEFLAGSYSGLVLNYAKGWPQQSNLQFLVDLPKIFELEITDWNVNDVSVVNSLAQLRYLGVETYCNSKLDFSSWPDLEECAFEWRPKALSLFGHRGIKRLFINKWNGGKSLEPFSGMTQLESLRLYSPSKLESLRGVESLQGLRRLELAVARRLESLEYVEKLLSLKRLELHTCRKLETLEPVASLTGLEELHVLDCGKIDSLGPLGRLSNLEVFLFSESTNVRDGELGVLESLPKLRKVSFQERRHYTRTRKSLSLRGA